VFFCLALCVGVAAIPSTVFGYAVPDEYGERVDTGVPYPYLSQAAQEHFAELGWTDYGLNLYDVERYFEGWVYTPLHQSNYWVRIDGPIRDYYIFEDQCGYHNPSMPDTLMCWFVVYRYTRLGAYDPNTYDYDGDGTPDIYDVYEVPPAPDTKGLRKNTVVENMTDETQGCHKETPGNRGGGMPGLFVNLSNLNFILEDKDIHYFSLGPTIRFARYYNARSAYEGIFGRGWTFSYGVHLTEEPSGDVVVVRDSGAEDRFVLQGDGTYTPPTGISDQLIKNLDGSFSLWVKDEKLTYTFEDKCPFVSYWDFNEGSGTTAADSVGTNNGTISGATWTSGKVDGALSFDGVNDYIQVPNVPDLNPSHITIEMWVKFNTIPYSGQIALNKEGQYRLIAGDVDTSHLSIRYQTTTTSWSNGTLVGNTLLAADTWYHAAATYDGLKWRLYLNGNFEGERSETGNLVSSGNSLYIGSCEPTGYSFNGFLDEVAIYARALTQAEIQQHYQNGLDGYGYLGEGSGYACNIPAGESVLTSVTDANGNIIALDYDANGLLTTINDAAGRTITLAYNVNNQVETITDHTGQQITFTYENGDMKSSTDVAGVTTTFTYDADHFLTGMTTPNGTTSFTYHTYNFATPRRVLETVTDAENHTTTYAFSEEAVEVIKTDPQGYTTRYGHNYLGYTTSITDHLGNTTTYEYDAHGNRNKVIDAEGKETAISYDSRGNITSITNYLSQTTSFVYDGNDNLTDITDPLTRTYHFDYDANDNLIKITDPLTNETDFIYLSNGLLEKIIDARDKETSFTYDAHGNLETVTDPLNHTTSFTYYPDSDKIYTSTLPAPLSYTTTYEYDPLGRLIKRIHPDATEYIIHRYCSGISGITDENGLYTAYEHDNINQRTKIIHALAGYETEFGYDGNGNLTGLTDPKDQATAFEYYENNWLKKITYPEGAEESYTYNPVGTLATQTDANSVVTTYGYDDLHRLTSITAPDLSIGYTYDTVGNLDTMIDSTGITDYAYDALDRLTTITYPNSKTIDYTYDAVGNITSIATEFGMVAYAYYDNNLLHTITLPNSQQVTYQYDEANNLTRIDYPNGTYTVFAYDTRNRLTNLTNYAPGDTVISSYDYTLDGVGNRTDVDLAEPLIPGFEPGTINYTYNTGNILALTDTVSYTHDANGNRTQKVAGAVTVDYTYDPLNRLTQVADNTQATQYIYNGLGQRVGKIEDGVQTNYLIDPNGILPQVLAEMDASNNLIAFYVYDGAGLVAKITPASAYYFYHYDGLGNTVAITDSSGDIVNAYAYSPYGLVGSQETIDNPFKYVGRFGVMAEGNGLYFMRARYYDPEVGRFINKDPIGYLGGDVNLYAYVKNNPVNLLDPWGLIWVTEGYDNHVLKSAPRLWLNRWTEQIGRGMEPTMPGATPREMVGFKRDIIQEWRFDPNDPQRDKEYPIGTQRRIVQTWTPFLRMPNDEPILIDPTLKDERWYYGWDPLVPNYTYKQFPNTKYKYPNQCN
jgi:RHS repeat-associated protein